MHGSPGLFSLLAATVALVLLGAGVPAPVLADGGIPLLASFNGVGDPLGSGATFDATIAAGPTALLVARNSIVALRTKAGTLIDAKSMPAFFASVRPAGANRLTDPFALFDPDSSRFFIVASDGVLDAACVPATCVSVLLFAVSKTATPAGLSPTAWHFYALDRNVVLTPEGAQVTGLRGDFDHLGIVGDLLLVGMQITTFAETQGFGQLRVLDKKPFLKWRPHHHMARLPEPAGAPAACHHRRICRQGLLLRAVPL